MSVLIKGMKMPTSCSECALNYDCFKCIVTGTPFFDHEHNFDDETTRLDNCSLVPVPKHGRLIDADVLQKDIQKHADLFVNCGNLDLAAMAQRDGLLCALQEVVNTPTIIEAEEGKI